MNNRDEPRSPVSQNVQDFYQNLRNKLDDDQFTGVMTHLGNNPEFKQQLNFVVDNSKFARDTLLQDTTFLQECIERKDALNDDIGMIDIGTTHFASEESLDSALRRHRNYHMLRIVWRDFNRLATLEDTTEALSQLACRSINCALGFHYEKLCAKYGKPRNTAGEVQPFLVLGMGKLGAGELNLSSDIDLIFAYPDNGSTDNPQNQLGNQEFFTRLGKKIIHSLDHKTRDGFVFRVDMRLRPYGQSGALVYSFAAMEDYYQTQGREWERYAMVKARVVANNGEAKAALQLMSLLRHFTYRKYIDFSVIDALRNLKQMITQEVKRRGLQDDVKLGAGGIREIEFIAQVFQLIRGGREVELQNNKLLRILPELAARSYLPTETVEQLIAAYGFLRNTEHGIQAYADQQTQKLPKSEEERRALHTVMGFDDWQSFSQALQGHRDNVARTFADLIAEPQDKQDHQPQEASVWMPLWRQRLSEAQAIEQLQEAGFETPEVSCRLLAELSQWAQASSMQASSRERLDQFIPLLLARLSKSGQPSETLKRLSALVKAVARRSAYLLLLMENPGALVQLLRLSEASPWIADCLADHPALLDELLDPQSLYRPPKRAELEAELRRMTLRIEANDLETQMETLRYFRSAHALRVAASEITGALPLMKVSDYLTWCAEAILDYVLRQCWGDMVRRYGYPDGEQRQLPRFVIVGYGKLGGIELGHGSDLDLVFIHDAELNGSTDGEKSLDNQTFFTRLGQKIIHFLTTRMSSGQLYEVDMRLRPSGNSGMLVTSMPSFERYQRDSAWTWEHQALVRARVVAGDNELAAQFDQARANILRFAREQSTLRTEVCEMRQKMREHLASAPDSEKFDLKHDRGGIVDIEFMVQYGVLAWAHSHPELVKFTDNIRILASFAEANLLDTQEVDQLSEAYKAFRAAGHRLTLQQQPTLIDARQLTAERQAVCRIWQRLLQEM